MDNITNPSLQAIPVSLRNLQSAAFPHPHPLTPQLGPDYDPTAFQPHGINDGANGQVQAFPQPRQSFQTPTRYPNGSFSVITPDQPQQPAVSFPVNQDVSPAKEIGGHFTGMKAIPNPPDLQEWRHKLFNIKEMITMTEDEFQTYFPHVDNIYSHRSTQRYKRKPFVSHYWDCRLKGRPPGTPKTDDPGKKKRRRTARQRDLCDVKIKITEYFPGAAAMMAQPDFGAGVDAAVDLMGDGREPPQPFGVLAPSQTLPAGHPGAGGARYYTIQRVSGGANGKGNEAGEHKHTIEESDAIKRNSVRRKMLKEETERKRIDAANKTTTTSSSTSTKLTTTNTKTDNTTTTTTTATATTTHPQSSPSSLAAQTAHRHSQPADLIFYGNLFCPFAQRIWITLEVKEIPYQYIEVENKLSLPPEAVEVNPQKRLPCIRHGDWGVWESGIMMEYCEDLSMGHSLLPLGDPQLRAHCRMWADHINRKIIPPFDLLLITPSTDPSKQSSLTSTLQSAITDLVNASHVKGPFFLGATISFIDVMFAPWIIRLSRVLKYYRRWPDPEVGTRWETWVQAVEGDERVRRTVSEEGEYQRVYKRRASQGVMTMPGGVGWALADGMVPDSGADGDGVMGT